MCVVASVGGIGHPFSNCCGGQVVRDLLIAGRGGPAPFENVSCVDADGRGYQLVKALQGVGAAMLKSKAPNLPCVKGAPFTCVQRLVPRVCYFKTLVFHSLPKILSHQISRRFAGV